MARREPRRYLVTGGAGFIGSHLCDRLRRQAATRSTRSTTCRPGSAENVAQLQGNERFHLTIGTVGDAEVVGGARRAGGRRRSPGRRRRRAARRREPGPGDRDQRALHGGRARAGGPSAQAGSARLHERGLRQERCAALQRGRRPADGRDRQVALGIRLLEGDRRVPRDGLLARAWPARDRGAPVQHRRSAADRELRDGGAHARRPGARGSAPERLRRRAPASLLLPRRRRRAGRCRGCSRSRAPTETSSTWAPPRRSRSSSSRDGSSR